MKDMIGMNQAEQERAMVCTAVLRGEVGRQQAAVWLGRSARQPRRVVAAYRAAGAAGVGHGHRGRSPVPTLSAALRARMVRLAAERSAGGTATHPREPRAREEGITVSRATVRRPRMGAGLTRPRTRRAPKHRSRRERMARAGMVVPLDGRAPRWLGEDASLVTLLAAIDDATGAVVGLVRGVGCPQAVGHDTHGIVVRPPRERERLAEQVRGQRDLTQAGRAMQQLGMGAVRAHSPQAKGRVERLCGTRQDRLVAALRLAGSTTLATANAFLPGVLARFTPRFAVPAAGSEVAYRPRPAGGDAWPICCWCDEGTVATDGTISFAGQRLQLHPASPRRSLARAIVEVREHRDGSRSVWCREQRVATTLVPDDAPRPRARGGPRPAAVTTSGSDLSPDRAGGACASGSPATGADPSLAPRGAAEADSFPAQFAVIVTGQ